ncbi:MAG: hypothetical protein IPK17_15760 [Chloroflexi bacterium]|uniref:hypothetical protein n=1 Tax=Candidatus Flexifilum breve TaxID=3140694 RepID=UPI0031368D44|nr:hypothetical protein [Chloroflexota bacterium]
MSHPRRADDQPRRIVICSVLHRRCGARHGDLVAAPRFPDAQTYHWAVGRWSPPRSTSIIC